jgi:hypothetical protein
VPTEEASIEQGPLCEVVSMGMQFIKVTNLGCESTSTRLEAMWQRSSLHPRVFDVPFEFLVFSMETQNSLTAEMLVESTT